MSWRRGLGEYEFLDGFEKATSRREKSILGYIWFKQNLTRNVRALTVKIDTGPLRRRENRVVECAPRHPLPQDLLKLIDQSSFSSSTD